MVEQPQLTDTEQHLLLAWNGTETPFPRERCIHELIQEQAKQWPDAIAAIYGDQQLTYGNLNRQANQLAHYLQTLGVGVDVPVGIAVERSLDMLIGLLAILKAGGAYVPLDPRYPRQRLGVMLAAAAVPVLLTQQHLLDKLPEHSAVVVCLDADWPVIAQSSMGNPTSTVQPENLAYIIYTSGSTGTPKGVAMAHLPLVNLLAWQVQQFTALGTDYSQDRGLWGSRTLQFTSISFDVAFQEIFATWLAGGTLVLISEETRRDSQQVFQVLIDQQIERLFLPFVALQNLAVVASQKSVQPSRLREVITAGEQLQISRHIRDWFGQLPHCRLHNHYGPSESHVVTAYTLPDQPQDWSPLPPIGRPIANACVYILDEQLQPVPIGATGELYLGGVALARGYLKRPDLTQERFLPHPFSQVAGARIYKTGDLGRYLANGTIEYLGRADAQIKIHGYRVELGEIETTLTQLPGIRDAVVVLREDTPHVKRLVAYITPTGNQGLIVQEVKAQLRQILPDYMVPAALVILEQLPLTPSGKIDRRNLPQPTLPAMGGEFIVPRTESEKVLAAIWGNVLGLEYVGIEDNFFELGGSSLLATQVLIPVQQQFGIDLPIVRLYEYPTVRRLAAYLDELHPSQSASMDKAEAVINQSQRSPATGNFGGVAIIGMAGRFPGAATVTEFWQNLCAGEESISRFAPEELDASVSAELRTHPRYVPARGILAGAETFAAEFFGISPREAEVMDPQARVFLELAYEALEQAGYSSDTFAGLIGLYAGSGHNTYFEHHISGRPEILERLGEFQTMLANEKDFLTTRASYKLNLQGPSLSINTGCSTSLVAVIQACQSLVSRQCDLALAGGVSITTPQQTGYLSQEGGMLSPDGRCRPFDANGQGTLFNNGAGLVVLKRLDAALADGDRIYAVIRGVGMTNDGANKVSFTAPSVQGQAAAILAAHTSAGIHPDTISYIEAHGTATPVGDPIEIEALTQAFRTQTEAKQFCAIGSVKSNVGHLIAAAGVTGLIKTALALYHQKIPASLNFATPNPAIDFANSPFYVNTQLQDWPTGEVPRRAGVSSFGVGGTNAHVVLEEAPTPHPDPSSRPSQLLLLSAKTTTALEQATTNLRHHLQHHLQGDGAIDLADVAYTLQAGRNAFNYRRFVVATDIETAIQALETLPAQQTGARQTSQRNPPVVFMFPGQGSQYIQMGRYLYDQEPVFRATVNRCAEILQPLLDLDLRQVLYPTPADKQTDEQAVARLNQTRYTQPALFTIEYALAQLWQSWGVQPAAMIGHSIGEFVAACLAGVFSLADALKLVATRAQMMWHLPSGSMLSVRLAATEVAAYLSPELAIAAINGSSLCVVSGPTAAVAQLQQDLETKEIVCKPLHTSHAFHSAMMAPIIAPFAELVQTIELSAPTLPFVSTVTATWITPEQATDPHYWASHLRETVRFAEGVQTLWQQPERILLEVGPRTTTATLARQQATDLKQQVAIASLGSTATDDAEWIALLKAIGQLWLAGVTIDWQAFYARETRQRLPLPTYPFERQRYWIDPLPASASPSLSPQSICSLTPSSPDSAPMSPSIPDAMPDSRKSDLLPHIREVLETTSGIHLTDVDPLVTFLELGFDSLSLTQVALAIEKKFKQKVTFRQLLETYSSLDALATFLDQSLPAEAFRSPPAVPLAEPVVTTLPVISSTGTGNSSSALEALVAQQLQIMARQLELLGQSQAVTSPQSPTAGELPAKREEPVSQQPTSFRPPLPKPHGPGARIQKSTNTVLTVAQQASLERIIHRYVARTPLSKRQTQMHRQYLSDPRTVSGFTPQFKEMVYPIVVERSAGAKLWDIDGNEYVDITNGFGANLFGWSSPLITDAIKAQLDQGMEIGPQTPLAGRVAKLITELTGQERVAFCNTGSEAVMAALRLARTVTGRSKVAIFAGAYHGTFDEVVVRQGGNGQSLPAAPGILPEMVENVMILEYGAPESLETLSQQADELAAILVEPVQSRRPDLQPIDFLRELRQITEQSGTALIIDEVVTGFRVHPGGIQKLFDIPADLATYGKVVGGGMPIGVLAGKAKFMDALDGGHWQFGDESFPEVGVTFFAGTFVRHPLALATAEAVLSRLQAAGPELQSSLAAKVERFAQHLNQHFQRVGAPIQITHFSSFFYIKYSPDVAYGSLLYYLLREKGIHIWEYRPCFFSLAHSEMDIEQVSRAFKESVAELQGAGFLPGATPASTSADGHAEQYGNGRISFNRNHPPQPGARIGKDPQGNPAWFIPDPDRPGKYLQVAKV
jgi:amino acid adenylation domain-containing protein